MVAELNVMLEQIADKYKVEFLNIYPLFLEEGTARLNPSITSDGLHLNAEGYEIWKSAIEKYVK